MWKRVVGLNFNKNKSRFRVPILSTVMNVVTSLVHVNLRIYCRFASNLKFPGCIVTVIILAVLVGALLLPLTIGRVHSVGTVRTVRPRVRGVRGGCEGSPTVVQRRVKHLCGRRGTSPVTKYLPLLVRVPFLVTVCCTVRKFDCSPLRTNFL